MTEAHTMETKDSGKRLSDAELENIRVWLDDIARRYTLKDSERHCAALLSHIAAITANRGSVSEERAGDIPARIVKLCESRPAFDWSNYREGLDLDDAIEFLKDDFVALDEAADALTAIQQAVSECSGGGACCEGMRETRRRPALMDEPWVSPEEKAKQDAVRARNPQQPSDTAEAFGVQPRSHRMSEGEK